MPILVLTVREREADKIAALDAGADDYVAKLFGMGELLARLRAALRRAATPSREQPVVTTPDFVIDLSAKTAQRPNGTEIRLTPTEWGVVEMLVRHEGKLVSQVQLLKKVWGPAYEVDQLSEGVHGPDSPQARTQPEPANLLHHRNTDGLPIPPVSCRRLDSVTGTP